MKLSRKKPIKHKKRCLTICKFYSNIDLEYDYIDNTINHYSKCRLPRYISASVTKPCKVLRVEEVQRGSRRALALSCYSDATSDVTTMFCLPCACSVFTVTVRCRCVLWRWEINTAPACPQPSLTLFQTISCYDATNSCLRLHGLHFSSVTNFSSFYIEEAFV